jgi:curved DNA-binding protein CbpA
MDHYETLGVSRNATSAEIKRAYRRLAVLYHPDKNPDPAAENFFKEVNQAYDVLSDPVKKRSYDLRGQTIFEHHHQPQQPQHRDPAYRNPNRPQPKYKGERQRLLELMADYLPFIQRATWFCLVVSSIAMIDFVLPHRDSNDTVESGFVRTAKVGRSKSTYYNFSTRAGRNIEVEVRNAQSLEPGASVNIESSLLFDIPRYINTKNETIRVAKSIYGNFLFAPVGLFILAVLGYFFRNNIETSFNLGVSCLLVLGLNGVIVLTL